MRGAVALMRLRPAKWLVSCGLRGSKLSLLEPVELPRMSVDSVAVQLLPPPNGRQKTNWYIQHIEVSW
jgi:hypothetical protein